MNVKACHHHNGQYYKIINLTAIDLEGKKLYMPVCEYCLKEMWQLANPEEKKTLEN